ncbi:hypothetical protein M3923_002769 [Vibrio metschnikovii]|nr:hypothetical protein [Vibrio metschnikovii]
MILAPVIIATYSRVAHFIKCVESLKKNSLATETILVVGIDYPVKDEHIQANENIKDYCRTITGFKKVIIKEWPENLGPRLNFFRLREIGFTFSNKLILTEDDNVFHQDFLSYMNHNLDRFENDETVFSVCGYNYPIDYKNVNSTDNLLLKAYSAWGVGIWKEKFEHVSFKQGEFQNILKSPYKVLSVAKTLGDHVIQHYLHAERNKLIYGDTWISLYLYQYNKYSIFPAKTLVENIGNDGSGINCGIDDKINNQAMLNVDKVNEVYHVESIYHRQQINDYFKLTLKSKIKLSILLMYNLFFNK